MQGRTCVFALGWDMINLGIGFEKLSLDKGYQIKRGRLIHHEPSGFEDGCRFWSRHRFALVWQLG